MSHSSKVDFLRRAIDLGYKNYLYFIYFICTVDAASNIERVKQRVSPGGHSVPKEKIEKRFIESLGLLSTIITLCHRVYLFDNSTEERSIEPIDEINDEQQMIFKTDKVPWWIEDFIIKPLYTEK